MLLASGREGGGAGERRLQVPSSRAPRARERLRGPRHRRSGRRRRLVAVGLRDAGYGGGGSGNCE